MFLNFAQFKLYYAMTKKLFFVKIVKICNIYGCNSSFRHFKQFATINHTVNLFQTNPTHYSKNLNKDENLHE